MTNVINFPVPERDNIGYQMSDDNGMAVVDSELKTKIGFEGDGPDSVFIAVNGMGINTDRKRLAEFLWCAINMIDSEARYCDGEYPARNYK